MTHRSAGGLHYWVAVIVLGCCAAAMQVAKDRKLLTILKKPLPIRRPLRDLDRAALLPYRFQASLRMSPDIVQELGTEDYINWVLIDPARRRGAGSAVTVFVTYYTDVQDQVPHVPEECYFQGAFTPGEDDKRRMRLDGLGREIPVRRLSFYPPRQTTHKSYVYYTICVNGDFYCERTPVRLRMGDRKETHLYYSKVEVSFRGVSDRAAAHLDERARPILDKVISELVKSHWPARGSERGGADVE